MSLAAWKASATATAAWTSMAVDEIALGGDPQALTIDVKVADETIPDVFVIEVTRGMDTAGVSRVSSRYLVRRGRVKPLLVCRLPMVPSGEVDLSLKEGRSGLAIDLAAGAERVRLVAVNQDVCRLQIESPPSQAPSGDLYYAAVLSQGVMFRGMGKWREAGDAFQVALRLRPSDPDAEAIALLAIQTRSMFHDLQCWRSKDSLDELPIDGRLQRLLDSQGEYLSLFPKGERAPMVRFRKAEQLAGCHRFQSAMELYKQVFDGDPKHPLSPIAREKYEEAQGMMHRRDQGASRVRDIRPPGSGL